MVHLENLVLHTLDRVEPIKQKSIRGNQFHFMNKDIYNKHIHKVILTRTRLKNRFLKEATR